MTLDASGGDGAVVEMPQAPVTETAANDANGLIAVVVGIAAAVVSVILFKDAKNSLGAAIGGIALVLVVVAAFGGLTAVAPGQARVIALFGRYTGTVRTTGLRWVNPLTHRRRVSTRIRNHETVV